MTLATRGCSTVCRSADTPVIDADGQPSGSGMVLLGSNCHTDRLAGWERPTPNVSSSPDVVAVGGYTTDG
jgi:hypothetical protein